MNNTYVKAQSREAMYCGQMKMKMLTLASGLIALVLVFSLIFKAPQVHAQTSCSYYASPNGTGNGLSPSTPFQISKFWSIATPGKTLCLLDGTYTNLRVPSTFAGTAAQPITIRALNDGKVLFDGGTSRPVELRGSYGVLEGVNVHGGDNMGFLFAGDHWVGRRLVIWNNLNQNLNSLLTMAGTNDVVEDCAVFGRARKLVSAGAENAVPTNNVVRRCWASWESLPNAAFQGSPTNTYEMGYGQDNVLFENVLGTTNFSSNTITSAADASFSTFRTQNSQWYGSISYITATSKTYGAGDAVGMYEDGGSNAQAGYGHPTSHVTMRDVVGYWSPSHPGFSGSQAFNMDAAPGTSNVGENLVGVADQPSACTRGMQCPGLRQGRSLAEALGGKSIWEEVPGICKRYLNGQLTNQPLWPWSMNERLKEALIQSGRAPVDVTQTIEEMFGPIPQTCTTGASLPKAMPTPQNLRVIGAN